MTYSLWSQFKKIFTASHFIITVLCVGLLVWQLWPGTLETFAFWLIASSLIWFPILLAICVHVVFKIIRQYRTNTEQAKLLFFRFAISILIVLFTLGLLKLRIPLRVSFCLFKSPFDSFLEEQHFKDINTFTGKNTTLNKRFGLWIVDQCAKDLRGGTYFRIGTESDWIDQLSYGFALNPNRKGTPFGNAGYRRTWIIGDWYFFRVSDDW